MKISLKTIRGISEDIKADKEWVNDSQSYHEYKGICYGLDTIIRHLEEIDTYNKSKIK